jgi:hypothetical protein
MRDVDAVSAQSPIGLRQRPRQVVRPALLGTRDVERLHGSLERRTDEPIIDSRRRERLASEASAAVTVVRNLLTYIGFVIHPIIIIIIINVKPNIKS